MYISIICWHYATIDTLRNTAVARGIQTHHTNPPLLIEHLSLVLKTDLASIGIKPRSDVCL